MLTKLSVSPVTILRKGDINIVDVAEVGALIARSETRVDDAFLRELSAEILSVATPNSGRSKSTAGVQELQRLGGVLFSHLLTAPARQRLRTAESSDLYLRLDEALLPVPWELSYDGEHFLVTKFRLGRQVITSAPLPSSGAVPHGHGPLRVLVIADPTETLPQAEKEAEQLCALLGKLSGVEVTLLGGREVRKVPLLAALEAHDIVHFAGHSQYDPHTPSHSGWVLHEGVLTAGELSKLARPPLLVFSNSCQAGVTAQWKGDYRYEGQAFGLGSAFLLAGVQNYVGTLWIVPDEESALVAAAFYQHVTSGLSLGEALLRARQQVITQSGWQNLTWASYLLYGDPAFTVLPTTHGLSLSDGSAVVQSQPVGVLQRKLAAILHADVKGYSRLIEADEVATLRVLTPSLQMMNELVRQHGGHSIGSRGDSLLAEFPSVRSAVQCAVEMQHDLTERNAALPAEHRIEFRMGIHVGEIVEDGEQLHGDGINIAVRVEGLAEAGGICISEAVYNQVKNKLPLQYEDLGHQQLKNIAEPMRVYRVLLEGQRPTANKRGKGFSPLHPGKRSWMKAIGAGVALLLLVGGIGTLWYQFASQLHAPHSATPQQPDKALPLPHKPSLAVLPFTNMSNDPEQEYFSDGMTDTLITDLSKLSGLFVIARNSTFTYKGKAIKPQQVSQELGVRYVVEGRVQKADTRVRIITQLVDATTGHHLWAERYDRDLNDLFAVQDEITQKIVSALKVELTQEDQEHFRRAPTDNLEAYDYYLRGLEAYAQRTWEANVQAQRLLKKALELDPQYAEAYAALSASYWREWVLQWSQAPQTLEQAFGLARKAVALDDSLPAAHVALSWAYALAKQYEQALAEAERAIALDPNNAEVYVWLAEVFCLSGRPEEAIGLIEKAISLSPLITTDYFFNLGHAYYLTGRYEDATAVLLKSVLDRTPASLSAHLVLAAVYSEVGREEEAQAEAAEVLRLNPQFSLEVWKQRVPYKDPAVLERHLAALRKAGLQ